MRRARLYHPQGLTLNSRVLLTEEKSHYLIQVMRYTIGQELILFHQANKEFFGKIIAIEGKKKSIVTIDIYAEQITSSESKLAITLIQGLAKNDKMDWIVQKAVELGAAEIYPVITDFSEVRLNPERLLSKQQHWQNIAISAAEQSLRTHVPMIHGPQKIIDCLENIKLEIQANPIFCLHPHPPAVSLTKQLEALSSPKKITLLIGPEGGFSPKEIAYFEQARYSLVTLGPRILRTETAAIVMQSLLQHQFGDL